MASNHLLSDLKRILKVYHTSYFFDNSNMLDYLHNIDTNGGNLFESFSKKILCLEVNKNNSFIILKNKNSDITNEFQSFVNILFTITLVTKVLHYLVMTTENYVDYYEAIHGIKTYSTKAGNNVRLDFNMHDIGFVVEDNMLHIYTPHIVAFELTDKFKYTVQAGDSIDSVAIVKNYAYFLLGFKGYNLKTQLYAFSYYIRLLNHFTDYYYFAETLLMEDNHNNTCNRLLFGVNEDIDNLKNSVDDIMKSSGLANTFSDIEVRCTSLCPVVLKLDDNIQKFVKIDKSIDANNYYIVMINNKPYEILSATYRFIPGIHMKVIATVTIMAVSSHAPSCHLSNKYPMVSIKNNDKIKIVLRTKEISDLRTDYFNIGNELKELNNSIRGSKEKIDKLVKKHDVQKTINDNVSTRAIVYYVIFACIAIVYIVMLFVKIEKSTKLQCMLAVSGILVVMVLVNAYLNYDYIEPFNNPIFEDKSGLVYIHRSGYQQYGTGAFINTGVDNNILNRWTTGDNFNVEYLGYFYTKQFGGTYTFTTTSDDESFIWITKNGTETMVVNNGGLHPPRTISGTIDLLPETYYPIKIRFGENYGGSILSVFFSHASIPQTSNGIGHYYQEMPPQINYQEGLYWEKKSGYQNYDLGTIIDTGVDTNIQNSFSESGQQYNVEYNGFFYSAQHSGLFTFYTISDDESFLWIADTMVVNNGGLHGARERSGTVTIVAGTYYPIKIRFGNNNGPGMLSVSFSHTSVPRTTNGADYFFHDDDDMRQRMREIQMLNDEIFQLNQEVQILQEKDQKSLQELQRFQNLEYRLNTLNKQLVKLTDKDIKSQIEIERYKKIEARLRMKPIDFCKTVEIYTEKVQVIERATLTFMNKTFSLFVSYHTYISSLDSIDLFKKMSSSLYNEKRSFIEYDNIYKYKKEINKKSMDIMKHDMIGATSGITMGTIFVLILSLVYLAYVYEEKYLRTYLIVAGILIFLALYIHFVNIIQPVRSKARNMYWFKPSSLTNMKV